MADKYARKYCAFKNGDCIANCQLYSNEDKACVLFSINALLKGLRFLPKSIDGLAEAMRDSRESKEHAESSSDERPATAVAGHNENYAAKDKDAIEQFLKGRKWYEFVNRPTREVHIEMQKWALLRDLPVPEQTMLTRAVKRKFKELNVDNKGGGRYISIL